MTDNLKFIVEIGITDRDRLLDFATDLGLEDRSHFSKAVVMAICNPARPPLDTGFELISTLPSTNVDDHVKVMFEAASIDPDAILAEAQEQYQANWQTDWTPENLEEALYEILVASNSSPSPADCGFDIHKFLPVTTTPVPANAPRA